MLGYSVVEGVVTNTVLEGCVVWYSGDSRWVGWGL